MRDEPKQLGCSNHALFNASVLFQLALQAGIRRLDELMLKKRLDNLLRQIFHPLSLPLDLDARERHNHLRQITGHNPGGQLLAGNRNVPQHKEYSVLELDLLGARRLLKGRRETTQTRDLLADLVTFCC